MTVNKESTAPESLSRRRTRRLRVSAIAVLLAGGSAAGLVYWLGMRSTAMMDDPAMLGFNRAEHRQMGQLFGRMGNLIDDWSDDLKQPGTQAILIVVAAILIAAGLFYIARLMEVNDSPPPGTDRDSNPA